MADQDRKQELERKKAKLANIRFAKLWFQKINFVLAGLKGWQGLKKRNQKKSWMM